jgi:UDP-N-acetylglucosamine 2-epimerase
LKVVSIVGARPQFIKAAPVSRLLRQSAQEFLVHTGQHYDHEMSRIFFDELGIAIPDVNLGVGSGPHGRQTGIMLTGIEEILLAERPDIVLVYGDTNSTLAGALAAAKLQIPVAHVEAGLRSYNRSMPEEINRVLTDHIAELLFCPTRAAVENLMAEGVQGGVHLVGDVMYDALLFNLRISDGQSLIISEIGLRPGDYSLLTIHRPSNADDPSHLGCILHAIGETGIPTVFLVHPRTAKTLSRISGSIPSNLIIQNPVGYLDMLALEKNAQMILTDSGGVQKEAYWLGVPCITLREETEWLETVDAGWNSLVGREPDRIIQAILNRKAPAERPHIYGDGQASVKIVRLLVEDHHD